MIAVKLVTDTPLPGQGETDERPRPDPSASNRIVTAAMTNAPPRMAPQETADSLASPATISGALLSGIVVVCMPILRLKAREGQLDPLVVECSIVSERDSRPRRFRR